MKQEIIYVLIDIKEQEMDLYRTEEEAVDAYKRYNNDDIRVIFYYLTEHQQIDKTKSFKRWFRR